MHVYPIKLSLNPEFVKGANVNVNDDILVSFSTQQFGRGKLTDEKYVASDLSVSWIKSSLLTADVKTTSIHDINNTENKETIRKENKKDKEHNTQPHPLVLKDTDDYKVLAVQSEETAQLFVSVFKDPGTLCLKV